MAALIEMIDIAKTHQMEEVRVDALKAISFSIAKGEFVSIIGPSGSGKSTLMHIIGCLDRPTVGSVQIAGQPTIEMDDDERARLRRSGGSESDKSC